MRYWAVVGLLPVLAMAEAKTATAAAVVAPRLVDGNLEDWNLGLHADAPDVPLGPGTGFDEVGQAETVADSMAWFSFAHGAQGLFVAAQVRDDRISQTFRGADMWQGDMVELLFQAPSGEILHWGINPQGDVYDFSAPEVAKAQAPLDVQAAARVDGGYYFVELFIPWRSPTHPRGPLLRPVQGRLRMNLALKDRDGDDRPVLHRTWGGRRHKQPVSFGTLQLLPAAPVPAWPQCPLAARTVAVRSPLTAHGRTLQAGPARVRLRLVNYQGAAANWNDFWTTRFDLAQVQKDLDAAARLRFNAIRIFAFYESMGSDVPTPEALSRLRAVVDAARARGLLTVLSFFPFNKEFRASRWPAMEAHLRAVVRMYRGDPAIAMWDLMNEPDHMWADSSTGVTRADVRAWADHMAAAVKAEDPTHLVTVGLAGHYAALGADGGAGGGLEAVDVLSVHGYFDEVPLADFLLRAGALKDAPLVLQEFGKTGLYHDAAALAAFDRSTCSVAEKAGLAGVGVWELFDHPTGSMSWLKNRYEEAEENYFGVLDARGRPKPRAEVLCRCLSDVPALRVGPPPE